LAASQEVRVKLLDPGFCRNDDKRHLFDLNAIPAKAGHEVKLFSAIQVKPHLNQLPELLRSYEFWQHWERR
jgi:hypothetical protein